MADAAKKAQKLAAARKKLKEFQQKSHKSIKNDDNPASSVTTANSSRHSSISNGNSGEFTPDVVPFEVESAQSSSFHNYFNGKQNHFYVDHKTETVNFFDSLPVQNSISAPNTNSFKPNIGQYECALDINDDVPSMDYPEVEARSVYGFYPKEEHPVVSSEDAKRLSEFLGVNNSVKSYIDPASLPQTNRSACKLNHLGNNELHLEEQVLPSDTLRVSIPLDDPTYIEAESDSNAKFIVPTNEGNLETNSKLSNDHELQSQLNEYILKVSQLEEKLAQNKIEYEDKLSTELGSIDERLQGHIKTIEIYIAENNKLSDSLCQSQSLVNQKVSDCEDLQGRLKASRTRVADLEKELQAVKTEKDKLDQSHVHELEINQFKLQIEELKQLKEETTQDLLELREKLNIKANENIGLQRELQDITHQFSLAQIKIEQITAGGSVEVESRIEGLNQQKNELEKQVLDLSQTLKTANVEKAQINLQYQHYAQQLNQQVATLANKLESISTENETLSKREANLVKHIGELEKHLQTIQEERINFSLNKGGSTELKKELDSALESIASIQKENHELQENYEHIRGDQDDLIAELATKKDVIEQLENELERLKVDQPNNIKLLATLESDKVAASRAVAQNATLKQELEEMQQAFVRMSNDKLELTEQLSSERFKTRELQDRLSLVENQLHTLTDAIEIKDNELTHIRETLIHTNKQLLQYSQVTDRLRHYEAQDGSSSALQEDLQKAFDQINDLTAENVKLKTQTVTLNHINHDTEGKMTIDFKETQTHCEELDYSKFDGSLDKEVAMKHLEEKFTRRMVDIANLTEEKLRLEHIVMQLQSETDTIGEYIALYQHQRGILQQRTHEKEEQLKRLRDDRINVRSKLEMINDLVRKLVHEKGVSPLEILEQHQKSNNQSVNLNLNNETANNVPLNIAESENNNISNETAGQILQLLTEIKSSNLIQPCDGIENIHPCSCCSGQLFTV